MCAADRMTRSARRCGRADAPGVCPLRRGARPPIGGPGGARPSDRHRLRRSLAARALGRACRDRGRLEDLADAHAACEAVLSSRPDPSDSAWASLATASEQLATRMTRMTERVNAARPRRDVGRPTESRLESARERRCQARAALASNGRSSRPSAPVGSSGPMMAAAVVELPAGAGAGCTEWLCHLAHGKYCTRRRVTSSCGGTAAGSGGR